MANAQLISRNETMIFGMILMAMCVYVCILYMYNKKLHFLLYKHPMIIYKIHGCDFDFTSLSTFLR